MITPGRYCDHDTHYTTRSGRLICVRCGEDLGANPLGAARMPPPQASRHHPDTSHGAAAVARLAVLGRRRTTLAWYIARGDKGGTLFEAAQGTGTTVQSMCGIVKQLRDAGYLLREERTRPSPSGNASRVHIITAAGEAAHKES